MNIQLDYEKNGLTVTLPGDAAVTVVEPQFVESVADQVAAVRAALRAPIGVPPLRKIVNSGDTVGIVFCDITRSTPDHIMIPVLLEELEAAGIPREQATLFNATGTHRANTDEELRRMLGDNVVDTCRIVQNDAHDRGSHILVGTTSSGSDVWIHKAFVEADVRILTGFIEPHFFAVPDRSCDDAFKHYHTRSASLFYLYSIADWDRCRPHSSHLYSI